MSKLLQTKTYALKKEGTSILKIGRTKNLERRLRTLASISGCNLDVVFTYDGDIELFLHTKFAHLRKIGEWFDDASGEIESFLKNKANITVFASAERVIKEKGFDAVKAMAVINGKIFRGDHKPKSALLDGSVGGDVARELYSKLPSHSFYEESVYNFWGCPSLAFIFDDSVYYVAPRFGIKFENINDYIDYFDNGQKDFSIENGVDISDLPSWDEYAVFMRNHSKQMIAEIERLNA